MRDVLVIVPIYKPILDESEAFSLSKSLAVLRHRRVVFIGPKDMDYSYYTYTFQNIEIIGFSNVSFTSIAEYNRLLLSQEFYKLFCGYEFLLILQTDAVLLQDELSFWCSKPYDYIGAPWPSGVEIFINIAPFEGDKGKQVRAVVGNGGLSLRRINKCIRLLLEFPDALEFFIKSGSSEDLFFSLMGQLSTDFIIPNEIIASRFSMELRPSYYYRINGGALPMGGHAWSKYEPEFWMPLLSRTH